MRCFIRRNGLRHPAQMGAAEVEAFLSWFKDLVRAKRPVRIPAVLSRAEAQRLLAQMQGTKW
jgi:hypothetical protein